jgi:metal-responsive CopG/Arc/MetJ family transcriptional regulator
MGTDLRRFTVSITRDMEIDLDTAKKEAYYKDSQSEMIRDLINRGLVSLKEENEARNKNRGKSA